MQQQKDDIVGYIYGDVGSTSINFAVNGQNLRKFDYILAPHKEGDMLVQVMDIVQHSDLKFDEAAKLMKNEERPAIKADVSAIADVIGYRDTKGNIQSPRTPFDAGAELCRANDDLIRNVLGLTAAKENDAYIGLLKGHEFPVFLNIDVLVQKHICILAKTGGGKSYACGVLVEELLKKKVPLVVIDTHGEYRSLGEPNTNKKDQKNMERYGIKKQSYGSQLIEYSPLGQHGNTKHLTLSGVNLEAVEILDLLPSKLSGPQKGVLYQAIKEIKEYKNHFTIRDIIDTVGRSQSNAKWNAIASLESLDAVGVFSETGIPPSKIVKKGKCSIINMKGVPPDVQTVVVARLTKQLFDERKAGKIPPFLLIVEEAHNYCPERGFGSAVSSPILRTIASEGRKFGMGLCIVSQRPAKVDKNIISQCNTNIILKVTNPNDLKAIISSVEGLTNQAYDEIQRLPIGVALVSGGSLEKPVMAEIRTRETSHGGQSVEISKEGSNSEFNQPKTKFQSPIDEEVEEPEIEEEVIEPEPKPKSKPIQKQDSTTEKAIIVTRVANRLGWVQETNPDEAIRILSEEAAKMDENVYKYLESLTKLGKTVCQETDPKCMNCPMKDGCKYRNSFGHQRSGLLRRK
jgi:DNA helicase HerA-like ATPase